MLTNKINKYIKRLSCIIINFFKQKLNEKTKLYYSNFSSSDESKSYIISEFKETGALINSISL